MFQFLASLFPLSVALYLIRQGFKAGLFNDPAPIAARLAEKYDRSIVQTSPRNGGRSVQIAAIKANPKSSLRRDQTAEQEPSSCGAHRPEHYDRRTPAFVFDSPENVFVRVLQRLWEKYVGKKTAKNGGWGLEKKERNRGKEWEAKRVAGRGGYPHDLKSRLRITRNTLKF